MNKDNRRCTRTIVDAIDVFAFSPPSSDAADKGCVKSVQYIRCDLIESTV